MWYQQQYEKGCFKGLPGHHYLFEYIMAPVPVTGTEGASCRILVLSFTFFWSLCAFTAKGRKIFVNFSSALAMTDQIYRPENENIMKLREIIHFLRLPQYNAEVLRYNVLHACSSTGRQRGDPLHQRPPRPLVRGTSPGLSWRPVSTV